MTFLESIKTCFAKYFDPNGRAKRSEYWYFYLFIIITIVVVTIIESVAFPEYLNYAYGPLTGFFELFLLLPFINAATRRLHDNDRSGWWQLLYFTGIGAFVVLYWLIKKGNEEENRFG